MISDQCEEFMATNTMSKKYSLVEWQDASAFLPDDDVTVLIHDADGDVVMGFHDGDDGWRYGATGERVTCAVLSWADVPIPPGEDEQSITQKHWNDFVQCEARKIKETGKLPHFVKICEEWPYEVIAGGNEKNATGHATADKNQPTHENGN